MSVNSSYLRGSEWRKWDLHIHSPKTFLANEYGDCTIDDFVQKVIDSGIEVIGLTNYFRFDEGEFEEIKQKLNQRGITVFPNLEFRTQPQNKENEEMHVHLIFSDKISIDKIRGFLGRLEMIDDKYCKDLTLEDIKNTSISFQDLKKKLFEDKQIKHQEDYLLVACPRGDGNFRPSSKDDGRANNLAIVIDKCTDILFGNEDDTTFFLEPDRYKNALSKPVVFCSDAHSLDKIGTGFTWIKADKTFEGLKQVIYEPFDRVRIQELKPEEKASHLLIDRIEYKDSAGKKKNVYLNPNLNSVIGSRAQGKSNLLKNIAYSIDPDQCELRGVSSDNFFHFGSFKVIWSDGGESLLNGTEAKDRGILFIPQGYLGDLVYKEDSRLDDFLVNLFENHLDFQNAINNYRKFENTNVLLITSLIREIISMRLSGLDKRDRWKKLGKKEDLQKDIKQTEEKIEKFGKNVSVTSIELKSHEKFTSEKSEKDKSIKLIDRDLVSFAKLQAGEIITSDKIFELEFSKDSFIKIKKKLIESDNQFKKEFIDEEIKNLVQTKEKLAKEVFQLENNIKPLQEKINKSRSLIALTESLGKKKEIKAEIETLENEFKDLLREYELKKLELIKKYFQFNEEYKNFILDFGSLEFSQVKTVIVFNILSFQKMTEDYINYHNSTDFRKGENINYKDAISFLNNPVDWSYDKEKFPKLLKELLDGVLSRQLLLKSGKDIEAALMELFKNRFKIDFLLSIKSKKGVAFHEMSDGEQMLSLLEFIFKFDDYNYPVILDQPEDDLDSRAISTTVIDFLKLEKTKRQIIIASHNANLVVCGDSENLILSQKKGRRNPDFIYLGGAIENEFVNKEIVEVLEGGKEALKKRMRKLNISR